ncbi:TIGR04255 family protein [Streptomyces pseudovenezuelae]|uniref:TIGR04255 family protein n=1 Tax=Streptomyces pseudovenezuelae TaxID=67350 RepID=UPI002E800B27|nr:TIGR04255 family protein [Streptomyces pseudovenezuelae]WUA89927.1 TIGR04255 family protein [Streptomyces pseudovenezuelae]
MSWLTDEPRDRRLDNPPIALVVCQVRHETEFAASDATRALGIKDSLNWQTDLDESVTQSLSVAVGQTLTASQTPVMRGWQMRSPDGGWTVNIQPDHFAIETNAYEGWDKFKDRLENLITAVSENVSPSLRHRVGLRFVNQITHPSVEEPHDWREWIGEKIYQGQLYESSGDSLRAAMQVFEVATPDGNTLVMRHGFQTPNQGEPRKYILDNDCSQSGSLKFDPPALTQTVESLHKLALRAFEMGTSPALRKYLGEED